MEKIDTDKTQSTLIKYFDSHSQRHFGFAQSFGMPLLIALLFFFSAKVTAQPLITSVLPNNALQGQSLSVQITGQNTNFDTTSASGTISNVSSVYLSQGSTTIYATSFTANNATNITAYFTIPSNASLGIWNVNIVPITGSLLTLTNSVIINSAQTSPPTWTIGISASANGLIDSSCYIGVASNATDGFNMAYDFPKPSEPPSNYVYAYFPHPEWNSILGPNFTTDVRHDTNLTVVGKVWNLSVATDQSNQSITLHFTLSAAVPSGYTVMLEDMKTGNIQNLRTSNYYTYNTGTAASRSFQILIGNVPPTVASFTPLRNALNVAKNTNITLTFSENINSSTLTNSAIKINGSLSGLHIANYNYNSSTQTVTITPLTAFKYGEVVTTTLTRSIKSAAGDSLASAYSWSFTTKNNGSSGQFVQSSAASVGSIPYSVTAGDFNGDGYLDLAAANSNSNTVSILLNNGNGTFTQNSTPSVGTGPYSVTAGDFNGDGYIDLAVANYSSNTVSILLNNGNGTFTQSSTVNVGSFPHSVTAGDFNGDGYLDLAVANYSSNTVSILLNNGNGTFTQSSTPSVGTGPYSVTAGDFNGDGYIDLAVANYSSNTVSILLNNGNGTFTQSSTPSVGTGPYSVTAGDFNGDGYIDLAVANYFSNTVSILLNNGNGTFTQSSTPSVGSNPRSVTVGDFNGDGSLDLAVANYYSNTVSILINNGNGAFAQSSTPGVGSYPQSLIAGDFNGNGSLDLAAANSGSNNISVLLNSAVTPIISSITPSAAIQGQSLTVTITGQNTNFTTVSGSGTINNVSSIYLSQGSTTINATSFSATSATNVSANFTIPSNASLGSWNVNVMPIIGSLMTLTNGFVITSMPAAPRNLSAQVGNTQVSLKWNMNTESDFLRYRIYRGTSSGAEVKVDSTTNGITDTTRVESGLINGTNYYFRITAVDIAGFESAYSNEVSAAPSASFLISIAPSAAIQSQSLTVTITGQNTNFTIASGSGTISNVSSVYLSQGSITITATSFSAISATNVSANFTIPSNASLGSWNVNVMPVTGSLFTLTNGFVINSSLTPTIILIVPNNAIQGQSLAVQITGQNTNFVTTSGSATINNVGSVYLSQGSTTITATSFSAISATNVSANFTIPSNASLGSWNVNVMTIAGSLLTLTNGFVINVLTPIISSIVPNYAILGQSLAVQITGQNTSFATTAGSATINNVSSVYFSQGSSTINATSFSAKSATNISANFTIPSTASLGNWNVNVMPITGSLLTLINGFVIYNYIPIISLSTDTIVFGYITPGSTATKSLIIANIGNETLTGTVSVISNSGYSGYLINKSSINIAAGGQDSIIITFSPTAAQDYNATLIITHNAPDSPSIVALLGTGLSSGPLLSLSPSSLLVVSNGNFSSTIVGTITAKDSGNAALSGTLSFSGSSLLSVSPSTLSISAGSSSNITVSISSVSVADGIYSGTITIIHNAPGSPTTIPIQVRKVTIPPTITASNQFTFSGTNSGVDYELIGIPGTTSFLASTIFSGTYKQDWRMYLDNGSAANYLVEYDGSSNFNFGLGKGFWVLADKSNTLSATLSNYTSSGAFPIPVQSGAWNIITNPFALTVSWNDVITYNQLSGSNSVIYSYNNGSWSVSASLVPYTGYYFYSDNLSALFIPYDPNGAPASQNILSQSTPPVSDQHLKVSISTGNVETSNVYAAFDEHVGNGYNSKDYFAPPSSFAAANIQIEDSSLTTRQKRLWIEHRAAVGEGQRFHLVVKNTSAVSSLTFKGIDKFPNDQVYLLDEKRNELYNLRLYQHIDVPTSSSEYRYSLLIGGNKFIDSMNAVIVPNSYYVAQNYPNPFNPATTIEYTLPQQSHVKMVVYDIMGREVATLVDGFKSAGKYVVLWNASRCASGVYFCRLTTGTYTSVRKMLLMK